MKARHALLVAFAAVTLTSVAAAAPDAAKQRVGAVITPVASRDAPSKARSVTRWKGHRADCERFASRARDPRQPMYVTQKGEGTA